MLCLHLHIYYLTNTHIILLVFFSDHHCTRVSAVTVLPSLPAKNEEAADDKNGASDGQDGHAAACF